MSHLDFSHHLALTKKNGKPRMNYITFPAEQSKTVKSQPEYLPPKPTRSGK
ncbi:MAG: hypothetical protein WCJ73_02015 [Actinomycetes bacterium]